MEVAVSRRYRLSLPLSVPRPPGFDLPRWRATLHEVSLLLVAPPPLSIPPSRSVSFAFSLLWFLTPTRSVSFQRKRPPPPPNLGLPRGSREKVEGNGAHLESEIQQVPPPLLGHPSTGVLSLRGWGFDSPVRRVIPFRPRRKLVLAWGGAGRVGEKERTECVSSVPCCSE